MKYLKRWSIITTDNIIMGVPMGCINKYENIDLYGYQAIIERFKRNPHVIKSVEIGRPIKIHAIVFPDGNVVTQF